ncbi:hypothetical protein HDU87_002710 [Geranomyces variabilis]|uniref:Uncharacterized protein n=1 Tax=Geranomyces variabilis TaxID=109894 RepID=A0AAD5TWD9_9FUNG|nr:hypothetical protein HDU87_002710 [Geranomyces variabilis]
MSKGGRKRKSRSESGPSSSHKHDSPKASIPSRDKGKGPATADSPPTKRHSHHHSHKHPSKFKDAAASINETPEVTLNDLIAEMASAEADQQRPMREYPPALRIADFPPATSRDMGMSKDLRKFLEDMRSELISRTNKLVAVREHLACTVCTELFTVPTDCQERPLPNHLGSRLVNDILDGADDAESTKLVQRVAEITTRLASMPVQPFADLFPRAGDRLMVDIEDGVARCSRCQWEVVGGRCTNNNCGHVFAEGSDYYDSQDEEEIIYHEDPGSYSEGSFVVDDDDHHDRPPRNQMRASLPPIDLVVRSSSVESDDDSEFDYGWAPSLGRENGYRRPAAAIVVDSEEDEESSEADQRHEYISDEAEESSGHEDVESDDSDVYLTLVHQPRRVDPFEESEDDDSMPDSDHEAFAPGRRSSSADSDLEDYYSSDGDDAHGVGRSIYAARGVQISPNKRRRQEDSDSEEDDADPSDDGGEDESSDDSPRRPAATQVSPNKRRRVAVSDSEDDDDSESSALRRHMYASESEFESD